MADLIGESEPEENLDAYLIDGGSETKDEESAVPNVSSGERDAAARPIRPSRIYRSQTTRGKVVKPSIRLREDINHLLRMIAMNENTNFHEIVRNGISSELQGRGYASLQELEAMEPDAVENLAYLVGGTDNV